MLEIGKWHGYIPRDSSENMKFRADLLKRCHNDKAFQKGVKEACASDILFYIDSFIYQFNPLKGGQEAGPFLLWDFQVGAIKTILNAIHCTCPKYDGVHGHDLVIEKSREMGASWLTLIVLEWLWHFHPYKSFLCVSRSEEAVEDESGDSLFAKIDFIHRHQPSWLLPKIIRRKRFFGNEDLNSQLTGQASTGRAGVGGRHTAIFVDEMSRIREAQEIIDSTADTSKCRIFTGTHFGVDTAFHKQCQRTDIRKLVLHWSLHPDKYPGAYRFDAARGQVDILDKSYKFPDDYKFALTEDPAGGPFPGLRSPWYDAECERRNDKRAIAEHLDINPGGSQSQFFDPIIIRSRRHEYCRDANWEGHVLYDGDTGRPERLVEVAGGPLKLWVQPDHDGKLPYGHYAAGADISTGAGATNSVLSILNAQTGEKVAEFATCTMTPEKFAIACVAASWLFKDRDGFPAYLCWEKVGPGGYFSNVVKDLGYPRMFYCKISGHSKRQKDPGWSPSGSNKRRLLDAYRAAIYDRRCINYSDVALQECGPYHFTGIGDQVIHPGEVNTDDPTGARYNHGDRVVADALAWMVVEEMGVLETIPRAMPNEPEVGTLSWRRMISMIPDRDPWSTSDTNGWQTSVGW